MTVSWSKPVYLKSTGTRVFAFNGQDGYPWENAAGNYGVYTEERVFCGWWNPNAEMFTNTPPMRDWEKVFPALPLDVSGQFSVRYGRRNGKPFAEVVE